MLPISTLPEDMPPIGNALPELPDISGMIYLRPDLSHPYAQRLIDLLLARVEDSIEKRKRLHVA